MIFKVKRPAQRLQYEDLHNRIAMSGCSEALDALKEAWNEFTGDPYPYETEFLKDDDDTDDYSAKKIRTGELT